MSVVNESPDALIVDFFSNLERAKNVTAYVTSEDQPPVALYCDNIVTTAQLDASILVIQLNEYDEGSTDVIEKAYSLDWVKEMLERLFHR